MSTGIGDLLRETRESQGRTLEDAALHLRLRTEQVRALEEERFGSFGGDVYARGFLKSYAMELGLDPQPLLDTYRREISQDDIHAPPLVSASPTSVPQRRGAPPPWVAWLLVTVVVLAALAIVGSLGGGRAPDVASPDGPMAPVGPADTEPDDGEDADGDDGDAPDQPEEPEPAPAQEGLELVLALEERSWMRITVDGTVVFEQVEEAGQVQRWTGDDRIEVRFGNAGGVRVELNGEDLGVPGGRGQVASVVYTPDGVEDV